MNCPVCTSEHTHPVTNGRRMFFRCEFCGFSWSDSIPDEETRRARYGLHRNDEQNEGYLSFLSRIIDRALAYTGMSCRGMPLKVIDWGSGPNPLGVKLLNQRGLESVPWDPFFASERTPSDAAFDLALCIETAEHFMHPRQDFHDLARVLKPGAWVLVHTHISPVEDEEFLRWWYIEDITHISFYSEKSLRILAAMASLSLINLEEGKIAMLRKPLPALIAGGINMDIEGQPHGNLIFNDSNPGKIRFSPGGCGRNMAENLSRLMFGTEFITVIGDDTQGKQLLESSRLLGIGISGMHSMQGASTSTYLSILDGRGNMAAAVSSMEIFEQFTPKIASYVLDHAIDAAYTRSFGADPASPFSVLLLDGNLLPETSLFICRRFPDLMAWLDPVSVRKAQRIAAYQDGLLLQSLTGIKLNTIEMQALTGTQGADTELLSDKELEIILQKIRTLRLKGISVVYVTMGSSGVLRGDASGIALFRVPPAEPISTTGAGDAFFAASLRQRIIGTEDACEKGEDLIAGSAGSCITINSPRAVSETMHPEALESLCLEWKHRNLCTISFQKEYV